MCNKMTTLMLNLNVPTAKKKHYGIIDTSFILAHQLLSEALKKGPL